jgi:alkyldihydroxyacetonephosphate synthase
MELQKYQNNNLNVGVIQELRKELPFAMVSTNIVDRLAVSHGVCPPEFKWIQMGKYPYVPDIVIWPETTEQVSKILKIANKHTVNVIPYGGGSGSVMGTVFYDYGICIDMKRFIDFNLNKKGLSVTVGVGWNIAQLEDELNRFGYTTGHFPQSMLSATIGGSIATIAVGTLSTKYGKFDDMLLALEAVLPTGEIIFTKESPKKSCGINLNHLFLGSEGSFGICTKATIKIWPYPESKKYSVYTFKTTHDGLEAVRKIISSGINPALVRLYDEPEAVFNIDRFNYEKGYSLLILGFEGLEDMVQLETKISDQYCLKEGGSFKGYEAALHWKKDRFSTAYGLDTSHLPFGACDSLEVSASWDKLEDVWLTMRNSLAPYAQIIHAHFSHMYHTGGNVYCIIHTINGEKPEDAEKNFIKCVDEAIDACVSAGGSISHHHGIGTLKTKWMFAEHNQGLKVMKKLKKLFDPNNIMNPRVLGIGDDENA